jgi:Repeat of unknown function (DUF5648)
MTAMSQEAAAAASVEATPAITFPLYRPCASMIADHLYTQNYIEHRTASSINGYADEGIVGYLLRKLRDGIAPLYRSYSAARTDRFYTQYD